MSSVECLREFVNERLTAAAEEIFRVFKQTIVEYEEEIDRQRRLLDIIWKPEVKLHRIELPQQHVCTEEEVLADQQICSQERKSSLEPEPPQVKEEQEELCINQEAEQLVLKEETDTFMLTSTYEESDHSEDQTVCFNPDKIQSTAEKNSLTVVSVSVKCSVPSVSHVAERQDQKGGEHGDSESIRNAEPELKNQHHKIRIHGNNLCNAAVSKIQRNIHKGKKSYKCDICGKCFDCMSKVYAHMRIHTGEKPFSCKTCGKRFSQTRDLKRHTKIHTGEKPFTCKTCGKDFVRRSVLNRHTKIHTGEKPHLCKTCGKRFSEMSLLKRHIVMHTGEKPYPCNICGKRFTWKSDVMRHTRIHTGEKPYTCKTCGKDFGRSSVLKTHTRIHTNGRNSCRNNQPEAPV